MLTVSLTARDVTGHKYVLQTLKYVLFFVFRFGDILRKSKALKLVQKP
jgi:hypothetical protein